MKQASPSKRFLEVAKFLEAAGVHFLVRVNESHPAKASFISKRKSTTVKIFIYPQGISLFFGGEVALGPGGICKYRGITFNRATFRYSYFPSKSEVLSKIWVKIIITPGVLAFNVVTVSIWDLGVYPGWGFN